MYEDLIEKLETCGSEHPDYGGIIADEAADAIKALSEFKSRMDNIKAIQYMWYNGMYQMCERVAYFDVRKISEDEVRRLIHCDYYDPRIAVMSRQQAEQVFGFKWQDDSNETEFDHER